jgi:hypothetical protein
MERSGSKGRIPCKSSHEKFKNRQQAMGLFLQCRHFYSVLPRHSLALTHYLVMKTKFLKMVLATRVLPWSRSMPHVSYAHSMTKIRFSSISQHDSYRIKYILDLRLSTYDAFLRIPFNVVYISVLIQRELPNKRYYGGATLSLRCSILWICHSNGERRRMV